MSEQKAILAKLHKIAVDVPYIQKDATNPHHKYKYASEKAIKEALGKAMRDHGVVFQFEVVDVERPAGKTDITCKYAFFDIDTGESFSGVFLGCGPDRDDKGLYAAMTGAIKYILTSTFMIYTGDEAPPTGDTDPEADAPVAKPKLQDAPPSRFPSVMKKADLVKLVLTLEGKAFESDVQRDDARHGSLEGKLPGDAIVKTLEPYRDSLLRIIAMDLEEQVYKVEKAWGAARTKYLGNKDLRGASFEKMIAYCKHMKEKKEA